MPATSGVSVDSIFDWKIEPRPAIPVASPSWRAVLFAPDAMPLSCGGTTPTAVEASPGVARPIPMPARIWPGSSAVHPDESDRFPISSSPTVTNASPVPSSSRTGTRAVSRPLSGATNRIGPVTGSDRSPASNGEKPSTFWKKSVM